MPAIDLTTEVAAPPSRVFDLARSIDLHTASMAGHNERPIAGVTSGLIGPAQSVTWQARHFGVPFRLTSRVLAFDPPHHFRDGMIHGPFKSFTHDHFFIPIEGGTIIRDVFDYRSPLGPLGWLADVLFLRRHMTDLLRTRNQVVKQVAESDAWMQYLGPAHASVSGGSSNPSLQRTPPE